MKKILAIVICSILLMSCKTTVINKQDGIDERQQKIEQLEKTDEYVPWWLPSRNQ